MIVKTKLKGEADIKVLNHFRSSSFVNRRIDPLILVKIDPNWDEKSRQALLEVLNETKLDGVIITPSKKN